MGGGPEDAGVDIPSVSGLRRQISETAVTEGNIFSANVDDE